jgi:hypothetical protein
MMADDPLKIQRGDDARTRQQKTEAELERSAILSSFETLGFTAKRTKRGRHFVLTCPHGRYKFILDASLLQGYEAEFHRARAEHREKCGREN